MVFIKLEYQFPIAILLVNYSDSIIPWDIWFYDNFIVDKDDP